MSFTQKRLSIVTKIIDVSFPTIREYLQEQRKRTRDNKIDKPIIRMESCSSADHENIIREENIRNYGLAYQRQVECEEILNKIEHLLSPDTKINCGEGWETLVTLLGKLEEYLTDIKKEADATINSYCDPRAHRDKSPSFIRAIVRQYNSVYQAAAAIELTIKNLDPDKSIFKHSTIFKRLFDFPTLEQVIDSDPYANNCFAHPRIKTLKDLPIQPLPPHDKSDLLRLKSTGGSSKRF